MQHCEYTVLHKHAPKLQSSNLAAFRCSDRQRNLLLSTIGIPTGMDAEHVEEWAGKNSTEVVNQGPLVLRAGAWGSDSPFFVFLALSSVRNHYLCISKIKLIEHATGKFYP